MSLLNELLEMAVIGSVSSGSIAVGSDKPKKKKKKRIFEDFSSMEDESEFDPNDVISKLKANEKKIQ